jgi:two-component system, LytTR family, response regulator
MTAADARPADPHAPRVLVVDDEPLARRFLHRLLAGDGGVGEIRQCANGLEARAEIARARPDIMFLDVEMPGLSGADLLGGLAAGEAPVTIFTTAYSQHAIKAFELEACDYLLKPFDEARFAKALQRAKDAVAAASRLRGGPKLSVQAADRTHLLAADQILAIASEDNYVRVRASGRDFLHRSTLAAVERALASARFLRVHRRYLVNPAHIREIGPLGSRGQQLTLSDGSTIPVSRRSRDLVKAFATQA